jgi:phosphonate transport system substrate-binding protein
VNIITLAWLALALATPARAETLPEEPIRFGSVAKDIPAEMYRELAPLTRHLSRALKRPVVPKVSPNLEHAVQALAQGEVDFAYLTPVAYRRAHDLGGAQPVVTGLCGRRGTMQLMIVVRADSPIRQVSELRGKRFAFGDPGALLQRAVVVGAGLPLAALAGHEFVGHYDEIARAVRAGEFDAGILKDSTARRSQGQGLRIVYTSPPLPGYAIAAGRHVPAALRRRVRDALLALNGDDPQERVVIKALDASYDGFAAANDADYDVIRRLIRPFENARTASSAR